jgi:hypothetical protein
MSDSLMKNKKGAYLKIIILIAIGIAVIAIIYYSMTAILERNPKVATGSEVLKNTYSIAEGIGILTAQNSAAGVTGAFMKFVGVILKSALQFVFGIRLFDEGAVSDAVVVMSLAMFFVIFLILGDIFTNFGLLEEKTGKLVGLLITVVLANLGAFSGFVFWLMGFLAGLAGFAVVAILGIMIFFAFAAHFGISQVGAWMMERKAMLEAAKTKAGGKEAAGTVAALREVGAEFRKKQP